MSKKCLGYLKDPVNMLFVLGYAPQSWECQDCSDKEKCKSGEK